MYYSYDIAAAHVIMIGSYADSDADSAQYAWLQQDLQKVSFSSPSDSLTLRDLQLVSLG